MFGYIKVPELCTAVIKKHVSRLDVSMDDTVIVELIEPF